MPITLNSLRCASLCIALIGGGLIAAPAMNVAYAQAAAQNLVTEPAQLEVAVSAAKPGATLLVADGSYTDFQAALKGQGSAEKPITIRAQTPGKVIFTGHSAVSIDGQYLVFSGFVFKDGSPPPPSNPKDSSASAIKIYGSHNRVTENSIINYSLNHVSPPGTDASKNGFHKWVGIWGSHNRVDHNLFKGKKGGGTLLTVWRDTPEANFHQIDHNTFLDVEYGKEQNGFETIRLGDSKHSQSDSNSVVEYNYFENCNGEIEFISNKSGGNIYRFNTIKNSEGTLTLRHGKGVTVENNVIVQSGKTPGGGIRVTDMNHTIRNNYIENATGVGDHWGGIVLLSHSTNPPLNDYWPIDKVKIENNSIINASAGIAIGSGRSRNMPIAASLSNNVVCDVSEGKSDRTLVNKVPNKAGDTQLTLAGNVFCGQNLGLEAASLGDSTFQADKLSRVNGLLISSDKNSGFQPTKVTQRADTGPRSYQP